MNKTKKSAESKAPKLEDYVKLASLPEANGIVARVVDALNRNIGLGSLTVEAVADELCLSKRTLQRRLKEQNTTFAELRDQVRFHHAINYLVDEPMSIEVISGLLDYRDRTSFTSAFKRRASGIPPTAFRQKFGISSISA